MIQSKEFKDELEDLINKHSIDNECETPDFILAAMLGGWLIAYREGMRENIKWHSTWQTMGQTFGQPDKW